MVTCEDRGQPPVKIAWNTNTTFGRFFYLVTCFLLLPVFIIVKSVSDLTKTNTTRRRGQFSYWFFNLFSFPQNRLLAHAMSSFMCLIMVLTETALENVYLRAVIIIYSIGYLLENLLRFRRKNYFTKSFYRKFDVMSLIGQLCLLVGLVMKMLDELKEDCEPKSAWVQHTVTSGCRCPRETESASDVYPVECELAACLHGLGVTLLTILAIFYWFQLHPSLGPLAVMITKQIFEDIRVFLIAFCVFYFAFSCGLGFNLYGRGSWEEDTDKVHNAFRWWIADDTSRYSLDGILKTNLWILFDPGNPQLVGKVQESKR